MPDPQDLAALVAALRTQRQIDMDGCEVAVSRQACDEAADALEAQAAEIARLTAEVVRRSEMHECAMAERDDCILDWSDTKAERDRLAAETARLTAERDQARAEAAKWHADANLMLGFADLAYEVGAMPTSSELIAASDRALAAHANAARAEAIKRAEKAEAALSESHAREAMWPEVVARLCDETADEALEESSPASRMISVWFRGQAKAIRALTPADAQAALDARINAAREEGRIAGLREAAELIAGEDHTREELKRGRLQAPGVLARAYDAILAKIKETEK